MYQWVDSAAVLEQYNDISNRFPIWNDVVASALMALPLSVGAYIVMVPYEQWVFSKINVTENSILCS
jgi:hypothetical protein